VLQHLYSKQLKMITLPSSYPVTIRCGGKLSSTFSVVASRQPPSRCCAARPLPNLVFHTPQSAFPHHHEIEVLSDHAVLISHFSLFSSAPSTASTPPSPPSCSRARRTRQRLQVPPTAPQQRQLFVPRECLSRATPGALHRPS
ncbi:hypothetical protein HN51_069298, partial [Arachis hypogaea]